MTAVALLVVLVTMFATFSRAEEKCAGGHINQNLCQKTCKFNKCTCDMVDTTSFSSCSQKCHILSSCPAMDCSGNQTLFSQVKSPNNINSFISRKATRKYNNQSGNIV